MWVDLKFRLVNRWQPARGANLHKQYVQRTNTNLSPLGYNLGYGVHKTRGRRRAVTVGRRSGGRLLYLTYTFRRVPSEHVYGGEKGREGENLDRSRLHVFLTYPNPWFSILVLLRITIQTNPHYLSHFNNFLVYRKKLFYI